MRNLSRQLQWRFSNLSCQLQWRLPPSKAATPVPPAPCCLRTRQSNQRLQSKLESSMGMATTIGCVASGSGDMPRALPSSFRQRAWRFHLHAAWIHVKKQHLFVICFKRDLVWEIVSKTTPSRSICHTIDHKPQRVMVSHKICLKMTHLQQFFRFVSCVIIFHF